MTTYAVEFLNGQSIDVVASSRKAAVLEAECLARAERWPSTSVIRTYLYSNGRRYHPVRHRRPAEADPLGLFGRLPA